MSGYPRLDLARIDFPTDQGAIESIWAVRLRDGSFRIDNVPCFTRVVGAI